MRVRIVLLFSLITLLSGTIKTLAQAQLSKASPIYDKGWFSFGIGRNYTSFQKSEFYDFGGSASINTFWGKDKIIQVSLAIGDIRFSGEPRYQSIFVGYGRTLAQPATRFYIGGGPELFRFDFDKNVADVPIPIGLTGHFHASFTPIKEFGLSFEYKVTLLSTGYISAFTVCVLIEGHK
jgi:hypothetical protein